MKINGVNLTNMNPYNKAQRTAQVQQPGTSFSDKLEISAAAKNLQVTADYKDQRAERVQKLKADIESGEYKVDARKVAEDMLKYYRF